MPDVGNFSKGGLHIRLSNYTQLMSTLISTSSQPTVAIAGGGLAGLAAACALADSGFRVSIFERRPYLGGRASSYEHPGTGEVVDNCQHVLFRICSNLVEFYRRIGVEDKIRWFDTMTFIEPGGRQSIMRSSPLPAPLHTAPSFLAFPFSTPTTNSPSREPSPRSPSPLRATLANPFSTGAAGTAKPKMPSIFSGSRS